jgi:hypothetical protein
MSANVTVTSTGFVGWAEQVIDQQSLAGDLFRFGTGVPDRRTPPEVIASPEHR